MMELCLGSFYDEDFGDLMVGYAKLKLRWFGKL
jgi:hypothetical protein